MTRRPYPSDVSDVTDEEWAFVAPYLSLLPQTAAQWRHEVRDVFNALRWSALAPVALLLGLGGLGGAAYVAIVARRLARWEVYTPVAEDWEFHAVLPLAAYTALVVAALLLPGSPTAALFVVGAALLLLVVVSIHNAWDLVTAVTLQRVAERDGGQDGSAG